MEKLIITVAGDSRTSYPHNNLCPTQEDIAACAQQYVDAAKAGAAISHIHGRRTLEESIQADGKMVSRIHHADWRTLHHMITDKVDTIMQYGVASARIEEKIELMKIGPDMMAVAFNAHDEYFQPVPTLPPKRMMAIHPVEELIAYAKAAEEHKVKLECECFQTGAFWHLDFVRKAGYLKKQTYVTLFIGWPGGTWMPPTERALQFFVDNLPPDVIWNVSVMNPEKQWSILALAVALGGHVRVGYEDNPYIAPGEFAKNNAVLVDRMVGIAQRLGREVATPGEARKIFGVAAVAVIAGEMQTRRLGTSGIEVSVVGVGCNNFGRRIHDIGAARAVVHRALDLGITLFDTADAYGNGTSESFLGETLGHRRRQVVIATKFGWGSPSGTSRRSVMQNAENSLKRLRTDTIDLYQVHFPDPNTPVEETLRALDDLVRQGKVRAIGCSNHSAKQVDNARAVSQKSGLAPFVTCQDEYSLLVRGIERDRIPAMERHGMTLLPYAPLAGGFLTGKYRRHEPLPKNARLAYSSHHASDVINERNWDMAEQLNALAARTGHSLLELAFGWLLAQPVTASVIAGASTPEQVEQNANAGKTTLSAGDLAALDRITR